MSALQQLDQTLIWHPFSNCALEQTNLVIERGQGAFVFDENNKKYLDLVSSWWVNLHGHAHPKIAAAIYEQAQTLEHIMFAGFTHPPALKLCEGLNKLLPQNLNKFFFSDNGSTAVEVAIKMAYQYWHLLGQKQKTLFLSFEGGYHGDTFGAMSLGQSAGYHALFQPFLFEVLSCPFPATFDHDLDVDAKEAFALEHLAILLEQHHDKIAAIILEPMIQGSSGMQICRPGFIDQVVAMVRQHGILVIFDEVMTGFGRTGKTFALNHLQYAPDLLCLSKGLSGGFLPLAFTVAQQAIFEVFSQHQGPYTFAHGHSYTANPIACAAACASLDLLLDPKTQNKLIHLENILHRGLERIQAEIPDLVHQFRQFGTISAFTSRHPFNHELRLAALEQGLILRPLKQQIYLLPPYCIDEEDLELAHNIIIKILKDHKNNIL